MAITIRTASSAGLMADNPDTSSASSTGAPAFSSTRTLTALQTGSLAYRYVVAIEGYPYLLTDAATAAAVTAWGGSDYTAALGGLYVDLENEQSINPWEPFQGGGKCTLRVQADANDTFGIDTHRKAAGAEALLRAAANRVGTAQGDSLKASQSTDVNAYLAVDHGSSFVAGNAYVGTECIEISSADPTRLNTSRRGKFSPFASGGSGGRWFSQHHRVAADSNGVLLNPTVSQQPRTWIGKWCGVWMHTIDGDGNLCSKADALCIFAGTVVGIADDPETGFTCVELEHVLSTIKNISVGRDMWSATITEGIWLATGRTFTFSDTVGTTTKTANALNVVASGAAGANQMNAGYYAVGDLCQALSQWLASEFTAARISGNYTWRSPVSISASDVRTKCYWTISDASLVDVSWRVEMPIEISMFLGLTGGGSSGGFETLGSLTGGQQSTGAIGFSNSDYRFEGVETPWKIALIRGDMAGRDFLIHCENERGTALDQYAALPSADKPASAFVLDPVFLTASAVVPSSLSWGIFLLDEKYLFLASIDVQSNGTTLQNVRPMSFSAPGLSTGLGVYVYGRRQDDANQGPATIRQVFVIETDVATFIKQLFYSTGTNGYNHPSYDALGYGLGLGIPGELLGPVFEASLDALTNAHAPIACVIDKSTKLSDLIGADLVLRHAFPLFKSGVLAFGQWVAPTSAAAVATFSEDNKAEPTGNVASQRSASLLDDQWVRNVVKIDYDRNFTINKDGQYQSELTFEDHVSVDDLSGQARVATIEARNTYSQFLGTGAGIEAIAPHFMATLPMFSRPAHKTTRSIDHRFFEGYAPGDVVLVTDSFMRDPETGARGVVAFPAVIARLRYSLGGPTPGNPSESTAASGEVDLFFLDLHRDVLYSPAAEVDAQYSGNGYASGYNATIWTLALLPHACSDASERADYSYFSAGDAIRIVEIDAVSPLSWRRRVTVASGAFLSLNENLAGWDATKQYRVTFDDFHAQQGSQQVDAVFASATTGKILGRSPAWHLSAAADATVTTPNSSERAELVSPLSYGDGVPMDVGHERALIRTLNAFVDGKSLHCSPVLGPYPLQLSNVLNHPSGRYMCSLSPIFLGMEQLSQTALRYLNVAPLVKFSAGGSTDTPTIWVTLCRSRPAASSGWAPSTAFSVGFHDQASTVSWTLPTTAVLGQWVTLDVKSLVAGVKDVNGLAWLCVECDGRIDFGGFARCMEGPRTT